MRFRNNDYCSFDSSVDAVSYDGTISYGNGDYWHGVINFNGFPAGPGIYIDNKGSRYFRTYSISGK